jgi:hypothetical protein
MLLLGLFMSNSKMEAQTLDQNLMALQPYQASSQLVSLNYSASAAVCGNGTCQVSFPAVPAGKRLLVTYAALNYATDKSAADGVLTSDVGQVAGSKLPLPNAIVTPYTGSDVFHQYSGQVYYYIDAGATPMMQFGIGTGLGGSQTVGFAVITGVLIPQ